MQRLLLRSAKDPFLALTPEASLARNVMGNNAGNMLFGQAVHKTLSVPGVEVLSNAYLTERGDVRADHIRQINEQYDAFVIPLANAFRPDFEPTLTRLTGVIEKLTIPVVVVGVGAQVSPRAAELQPSITEATTRFMRAVLDRSARVGVRGDITRRCLAQLGFGDEHVEVIGCPSLFASGRGLTVTKRAAQLTSDSPIAVNLTPTRFTMAEILNHNAARYARITYIPQESKELALLLWGEEPPEHADPRLPFHRDHPMLTSGRVKFFLDPFTWHAFLAEQDFAFGTRIHGNIAALEAGTPAHVLAFDSRTQELADYHDIPWTPLEQAGTDLDADDLYQRSDYTAFNTGHPEKFDRYLAFLELNGLSHIYQAGEQDPDFEERLAAVNFPAAVTSVSERPEIAHGQLLDRLRWLRQGNAEDARRTYGAFVPEFTSRRPPTTVRDLEKRLRQLEKTVAGLQKPRPVEAPKAPVARSLPHRGIRKIARMVKKG